MRTGLHAYQSVEETLDVQLPSSQHREYLLCNRTVFKTANDSGGESFIEKPSLDKNTL